MRSSRTPVGIRPHPCAPGVGQPPARPRQPGPGRDDVPRPAGPARGPTRCCAIRRAGLVAISDNQAATHPDVPWAAVVHNGLRLAEIAVRIKRTDSLCFVGRVVPEKGIVEAIEIAVATDRPLRIAAKAGPTAIERDYYENVFRPAMKAAGSLVEFLGELDQPDRDDLFAQSYASLMPGSWPEPFGLVLIESLAAGTPVIARRIGALPEILRDGIDGFFGDDVAGMAFKVDRVADLDRQAIREIGPRPLLGRTDDRSLRGRLPCPARCGQDEDRGRTRIGPGLGRRRRGARAAGRPPHGAARPALSPRPSGRSVALAPPRPSAAPCQAGMPRVCDIRPGHPCRVPEVHLVTL